MELDVYLGDSGRVSTDILAFRGVRHVRIRSDCFANRGGRHIVDLLFWRVRFRFPCFAIRLSSFCCVCYRAASSRAQGSNTQINLNYFLKGISELLVEATVELSYDISVEHVYARAHDLADSRKWRVIIVMKIIHVIIVIIIIMLYHYTSLLLLLFALLLLLLSSSLLLLLILLSIVLILLMIIIIIIILIRQIILIIIIILLLSLLLLSLLLLV